MGEGVSVWASGLGRDTEAIAARETIPTACPHRITPCMAISASRDHDYVIACGPHPRFRPSYLVRAKIRRTLSGARGKRSIT